MPSDYIICPCCGTHLSTVRDKRYAYNNDGSVKFIGSSEDSEVYFIVKCENNEVTDQVKIGKWTDREKLFKEPK